MTDNSTAQTAERDADGRTIDPDEIARFGAMAETWWDPTGPFKPLHKFNPTRLAYIRDALVSHFEREPTSVSPLEGLRLLDIGCGGGLVSEPMRRLGAEMVGVDASERNIGVARLHARESGLEIDYRCTSAEALADAGESFDAILNLEVVEHVADLPAFLAATASMVRPGGVMIVATLNRTVKSLALAKIGAEYILGWLPRGTHDWRKFVRPADLASLLRQSGLDVRHSTGVSYNPLTDRWSLSRDLSMNYLVLSARPAA